MSDVAPDGSDRSGEQGAAARRDEPFVQSLDRGLRVIRALSAPEPQTLSEVARATGVSRASARRFLLTLQQIGYVQSAGGRFALTPRVLELGHAYLSGLSLPQVAEPHLQALVELVHESSSVSVLDSDEVVYVARVPARRIMHVALTVGARLPAFATSMGRVLLTGLEPAALRAAVAAMSLPALTPATITDRAALLREIEATRERGWALVDEELEPGLRSIAAPIRDRTGTVVAAVNLSTPAGATTVPEMRRRLLPPLLAAAAAIERDLAATAS